MLEFDTDSETLRRVASYWHKPEIWAISPSPEDPDHLITVHNDGEDWRITIDALIGTAPKDAGTN